MVKLTGPALAAQASGTIGRLVTFSTNKGRPYLKLKSTPRQPRTDPQMAMRHILTFISQEWVNLGPVEQDAWDALPVPEPIPTFNKYQKHNLERWRNFQAPSAVYPVTEIGTSPQEVAWSATCLVNHALLKVQIGTPNAGWGVAFFRRTDLTTPYQWHELIHIQHLCGTCWHTFDFRAEESGWHRFAFHTFTTDGKFTRTAPRLIGNCNLTV